MKNLRSLFLMCALPAVAAAQGMTQEQLLKPLGDDWPTYNGDYSGKRYSQLTQISMGTGSPAAAATNSPYPIDRLDPTWMTLCASVEHSFTGKPHFCAAACNSISRAVPPACRITSKNVRIDADPSVS